MAWTEEDKKKVISMYQEGNPTPENSAELLKEISDSMDQTPNGVRMVLMQAGVYVKKADAPKTSASKESGEGTKRVSKESQIAALREAIEARNVEVDEEILSKMTGKAAAYFVTVLKG